MNAAICAQGLTKRFGAVTAVEDLSFEVPQGRTFALLGANGAGKTTTLAMLLGLMTPSAGRVTVLGQDMARHRYCVLGRMNYASPYVDLPQRLTVRENLRVYARLYGLRHASARIDELAQALDLHELIDRPYRNMSAGQKTRVALAKALLNTPEVLLLDEPTASLDPDTGNRIRGYLQGYREATGATLLLASHNMPEVERLCDHVLLMRAGRLVDRGAPAELVARYGRSNLEQVFLDVARRHQPGATA